MLQFVRITAKRIGPEHDQVGQAARSKPVQAVPHARGVRGTGGWAVQGLCQAQALLRMLVIHPWWTIRALAGDQGM